MSLCVCCAVPDFQVASPQGERALLHPCFASPLLRAGPTWLSQREHSHGFGPKRPDLPRRNAFLHTSAPAPHPLATTYLQDGFAGEQGAEWKVQASLEEAGWKVVELLEAQAALQAELAILQVSERGLGGAVSRVTGRRAGEWVAG